MHKIQKIVDFFKCRYVIKQILHYSIIFAIPIVNGI
jgi:hypothetical protein